MKSSESKKKNKDGKRKFGYDALISENIADIKMIIVTVKYKTNVMRCYITHAVKAQNTGLDQILTR